MKAVRPVRPRCWLRRPYGVLLSTPLGGDAVTDENGSPAMRVSCPSLLERYVPLAGLGAGIGADGHPACTPGPIDPAVT
jgi:hypothetical protein